MRAILFDLDGVFYVGDEPVAGAAAALEWVRTQRIPHLFLTNTSSRPRTALVQKLRGCGVEVQVDQILTPPVAAMRWIREHVSGASVLFVPEATRAEFADLPPVAADGAGAVVVGDLGEAWDFHTFNSVFRLLMREPRPALVALGMTRYWRAPDGLRLDVGAFVTGLEYASGVTPVVLGKPAAPFFETALDMLGCRPDEALMIGDDVRADVGGAQAVGIGGVLVRTGKFQAGDLEGDINPVAVLDSVAELPAWWREYFPGG